MLKISRWVTSGWIAEYLRLPNLGNVELFPFVGYLSVEFFIRKVNQLFFRSYM